ncbi:MAG: FAD binding domain-containing protein [Treponema sp.]|nr:FAD binding domain-containing protein [Treponema sp.]
MSKTILYAKNTTELIKILNNNPGTKVVGGCTRIETLPEKFISTHGIKELAYISRHERYIDVGPGTTLSEILSIGQNHLPPILYEALNCIANPIIRNTATIGGNICSENHKLTLFAPLMALDAKLEFKNLTETRTENIRNFRFIPQGFILSNIRIPLVDAELSIFRRIGPEHAISQQSASFAFLADTEKNWLLNVHLAFAGPFTFHSKEFENIMSGRRLPLSQRDITHLEEAVAEQFQKAATDQMIPDVMRQQFFNLARYSFEQLT